LAALTEGAPAIRWPALFTRDSEEFDGMADTIDPKYLDKRTAERHLRSGTLDDKEYAAYLKSLPDVAEKSVPVETVMHDEVDDFDDEDDEDEGDEESASDE
jgi:hypothetical protein